MIIDGVKISKIEYDNKKILQMKTNTGDGGLSGDKISNFSNTLYLLLFMAGLPSVLYYLINFIKSKNKV